MKTYTNIYDTKITLEETGILSFNVYSNGNLIGKAGFEYQENAYIYTSLLTNKKRKFKEVQTMVRKLAKEKA